jgi:hypothetical protein
MVFNMRSTMELNAALHSGPQGSRQPTAATIRRAQQNDLDAIVLRSVIG